MRVSILAAFVVLSLPLPAISQAFKCNVEGKPVYQGTPCLTQGKAVNLSGAGQSDATSSGTANWKKEAARMDAEEREEAARRNYREKAEAAIFQKSVFVGMTTDHVVQSWGKPTTINQTVAATGSSEQWVYSRASVGGVQYVYIENGKVSSIHTSK